MNREDMPKMPTQTIELFSWEFLKQHYRTKPIIQKYFGEIGADFVYAERAFNAKDNSVNDDDVANFIREINRIRPAELLDDDFSVEHPNLMRDKFEAAQKYLFDRPYFFLFTNDDERNVAALLLLLDNNLDSPSPQYYGSVMRYIHLCNLRDFNLSDNEIDTAKTALTLYRAKYILAKLGPRKTKKLLDQFFNPERLPQHVGKFYDFLDVALGELHSESKFLRQSQPRQVDVDELENFDQLFEYPVWIEFTDAAHQEIINRILKDELNPYQIQFYLQTYREPHNYTNLYPALKHILQTTDDFVTFYCAGDYFNQIWKNITDKEMEDWFKHEVYDTFWPRVGGVWPFQHSKTLGLHITEWHDNPKIVDFLDGHADDMLRSGTILCDAMNWITCLEKTNPELEKYFRELTKKDFDEIRKNFPDGVGKRVFAIKYKKLSPKDKVEAVFREYGREHDTAWRYLAYPDNIEEAKVALEKIFEDDTYFFNQLFALEQLVLTGNLEEVGAYVLNYLVDTFQQFSENLQNHPEYIISIFTAACSGATEHSEIEPLEKLADQCRKLEFENREDRNLKLLEIDAALSFAKNRVKKFNQERDDLTKNLRQHVAEVAS